MSVLRRRPAHAGKLARWAWITVALVPAGWTLGIVLAFLGGEGEAGGGGPVTVGILGILLFVAAPATAVVLAVKAARAGHRSGRAAVMVSVSLLLATLFLTLLLGRIGLIVAAVVTVLVFIWARPLNKPSPPGPDGMQREGEPPSATGPPGCLEGPVPNDARDLPGQAAGSGGLALSRRVNGPGS